MSPSGSVAVTARLAAEPSSRVFRVVLTGPSVGARLGARTVTEMGAERALLPAASWAFTVSW
ncbi:hypothetical protein ACN28S_30320 [Cystobacter fuscus]